MAHRGQNNLIHPQPCLPGGCFIQTSYRRRHVKHLYDGAPLGSQIPAVSAADIVRRDPPLFIGGARQRNQRLLSRYKMPDLYCVPHRVNVLY